MFLSLRAGRGEIVGAGSLADMEWEGALTLTGVGAVGISFVSGVAVSKCGVMGEASAIRVPFSVGCGRVRYTPYPKASTTHAAAAQR